MAVDAGTFVWTFPALGQATDAAQLVAGNCTPIGVKCFFLAVNNLNVFEVGAMIGDATAADTYAFTVATAPLIGGAYTVRATVTGPVATAIPQGTCIKRSVNIPMRKGNVLAFEVTDASAAAGTAMFYAIGSMSGDPRVHGMAATGLVSEIISSTA